MAVGVESDSETYSAAFLSAIATVKRHEAGADGYGGYHIDATDPGGETRWGIAKRYHPRVNIRTLSWEQAQTIYWREYWIGGRFSELRADVAIKIFDLYVNMESNAIRCLQRAVRAQGAGALAEDGMLGPKTLATVNSYSNPQALLAAFRSEAAGYYRQLALLRPAEGRVNLEGWLRRAYE